MRQPADHVRLPVFGLRRIARVILIALVVTSCFGWPSGTPGSDAVCDETTSPPSTATAIPPGEVYLPTYCPMEALPVAEIPGR